MTKKWAIIPLQTIFFGHVNLTKKMPFALNETRFAKGLIGSVSTCFEIKELIECLYVTNEVQHALKLKN